jgi:cell division protein FtsN
MSRDMKPRKSQLGEGRNPRGGTLIGLFIGLVIGVVAAAGVVWYINKAPTPFADKGAAVRPRQFLADANGGSPAPMALPGKPGDPVPAPTAADAASRASSSTRSCPATPTRSPTRPPPKPNQTNQQKQPNAEKRRRKSQGRCAQDPLYLQTGSFQNAADADNQKAKLALMGAEASCSR